MKAQSKDLTLSPSRELFMHFERDFYRDASVKVLMIIPEIRIFRLTFHRKPALKS